MLIIKSCFFFMQKKGKLEEKLKEIKKNELKVGGSAEGMKRKWEGNICGNLSSLVRSVSPPQSSQVLCVYVYARICVVESSFFSFIAKKKLFRLLLCFFSFSVFAFNCFEPKLKRETKT